MKTQMGSLSKEDEIYGILEEEILTGALGVGEQLREQALSERLGASRTPVRAALIRLADEGLVELSANRGASVRGVSEEDLVDIYRIRMRLEGLASRMAAQRITEAQKRELTEALELSEFYIKKEDAEHLRELDTAFHKTIYLASGNRLLCKILSELHRNIRAYRKRSLSVPGRVSSSIAEHREILAAIIDGNAELADELTSLHIQRAMENLLQ